jgi:DNA-binding transcriptional MerR regulator
VEGEMMTISEAAREAGLSIYTLRYYERAGLLAPVERDSSGHRRYSAEEVGWIVTLASPVCLSCK